MESAAAAAGRRHAPVDPQPGVVLDDTAPGMAATVSDGPRTRRPPSRSENPNVSRADALHRPG